MTYLVVVVVVDSVVLDDEEGEEGVAEGVDGVGDADGVVVVVESVLVVVVSRLVVPGDADGVPGAFSRSETRSLRSVQPATRPAPNTRTQTPVSNFCIVVPPQMIRTRVGGLQPGCRRAGTRGAADPSIEVRSAFVGRERCAARRSGQNVKESFQ
jgi:hypothetical protein